MDKKNTYILKILNNIKSPDFIYLNVILLLFFITFILFTLSTNFIIQNINKIFLQKNDTQTQILNEKNYLLVAKKLNLPTNIIQETVTENKPTITTKPEIVIDQTPTEDTNKTINTEPVTLNKEAVTIGIYNSTNKKGVASVLSQALFDTGFSMAFTGNEKRAYDTTTIFIKENMQIYLTSVKEAVLKTYPKAIVEVIPNDPTKVEFDVKIIIGKE
jgi:hypothetical protein